MRLLSKNERDSIISSINLSKVHTEVIKGMELKLVGDLFPERLCFWEAIKYTSALIFEKLLDEATSKYVELYDRCSKGPDKYAELFLQWLDYVREVSCETSSLTLAAWAEGYCSHGL